MEPAPKSFTIACNLIKQSPDLVVTSGWRSRRMCLLAAKPTAILLLCLGTPRNLLPQAQGNR